MEIIIIECKPLHDPVVCQFSSLCREKLSSASAGMMSQRMSESGHHTHYIFRAIVLVLYSICHAVSPTLTFQFIINEWRRIIIASARWFVRVAFRFPSKECAVRSQQSRLVVGRAWHLQHQHSVYNSKYACPANDHTLFSMAVSKHSSQAKPCHFPTFILP